MRDSSREKKQPSKQEKKISNSKNPTTIAGKLRQKRNLTALASESIAEKRKREIKAVARKMVIRVILWMMPYILGFLGALMVVVVVIAIIDSLFGWLGFIFNWFGHGDIDSWMRKPAAMS
jgi:uncharacterized membrane protein